mmetsp:Transcript_1305/g.1564  ORF Transcript_1305/g.1564 Transcript_1305/m.1564 type:complete len:138 (+) Transcript_1305:160-573(+)
MDGYHYPLNVLKSMPDSADKIYRRGAPDTFDCIRLKNSLLEITQSGCDKVYLPGFDHAVGDPVENAHCFIRADHKIVIMEGLYLLHKGTKGGWDKECIPDMFDYSIFIESDLEACIDRLKTRNKCIPGYTAEEIEKR